MRERTNTIFAVLAFVAAILACAGEALAGVQVKVGATSVILPDIFVQDTTSSNGAGLTGLTSGSSGLTCYYHRNTASASVAVSLVSMTLGTFTSGGFLQVDATNMPGVYSFCPPDAALASGAQRVAFTFQGATSMAPVTLAIELVAFDPLDAIHLGLSSLPNTAVTTNGSLLTSGTGTDQLSVASGRTNIGKILDTAIATPATAGILDVNVKNIANVVAALDANSRLKVDTDDLGGTAQTGRDVGASVLLSAGTAAGQLDFTSGIVKSNVTQCGGSTVAAGAIPNAAAGAASGLPTLDANGNWTPATLVIRSNTAQAGAAGSITLDAAASATNGFYNGAIVTILSGTGAGQSRIVTGYTGTSKVATVAPNWATNPGATSVFALLTVGQADVESWANVAPNALQSGRVDASVGAYPGNTVQTGDAYAIVNNGAYGNAQLVRSTTPANTLTVDATHYVGANAVHGTCDTLTTYTGNTPQTGDAFARLGAPAGANVSADIAAVKSDSGAIKTKTDSLTFTVAGVIDANPTKWVGGAIPAPNTTGVPIVDTKYLTGTLQTARDLGNALPAAAPAASGGLLTVGTGAGQLNPDGAGNVSLRALDTTVLHSGTAQAGGAATITLASGASATDALYVGCVVKVYGGAGAAQARVVTAYVGATKVAAVDRAWSTNPDATSLYAVLALEAPKLDGSLQVTAASVQGNVTGSVASVTGAVGSVSGSVGSIAGITFPSNFGLFSIDGSGRVTLTPTEESAIASSVWGYTIESVGVSWSAAQILRVGHAIDCGKSTGFTGSFPCTVNFTAPDGTTSRMTYTLDSHANRTAVTPNP